MTLGAGSVDLGSAYGRIEIDWSQVQDQMNRTFGEVERRAGGFFDSLGGKLQSWGDNISSVGQAWTKLMAPFAAIEAAGIKVYGTFEDVLAEIQARTGATAEEMAAVSAYALQMGADTAFSGTQAAEAMLQLLSSGYDLKQTFAALPAVLNAAAAGGMDLGYTADVVTDALAMWGLGAESAGRVSDALARGAAASSADISDLAMGLGNVGPIANEFGLSIEDTIAILAAFSERGIKGAEAGTQLRSMLTHMSSDTEDVTAMWEKLGISMFDANGQARPLTDVMEDLRGKLVNMSDEERIQTIKTLAGAYGQMGLTILASDPAMQNMLASMNEQSDAATVAAARMDTLNGRIDTMKGSIETALINALKPFIEETLKPGIETMTGFINRLNDWVVANPVLTTQIVKLVTALIMVGPALLGIGKTISNVGELIGGLSNTIGWLIMAAVLLYEAWSNNWLGIRDIVDDVIGKITAIIEGSRIPEIFNNIMGALKVGDWSGALNSVGDLFEEIYSLIAAQMPAVMEALEPLAQSVLDWIIETAPKVLQQLWAWSTAFVEWIAPMIPPLLAKLGELATMLWDWIVQQVPVVIEQLITWGRAFVEWIAPMIPPLLAKLGEIAVALWDWIVATAPGVIDKLITWGKAFIDWVLPLIPPLLEKAAELARNLIDWIVGVAPDVITQLGEWASAFIDWVAPAAAALLEAMPGLSADLLKWVLEVTPDIIAQLLEWAAAFVEWVGPVIGDLIVKLGELLAALIEWIITDLIPAVIAEMPGLAEAFLGFVGEMITKVGPALWEFINALSTFFTDEMIPAVMEAANKIGDGIVNGVKQGINDAWDGLTDWFDDKLDDLTGGIADKLGIHSPSTLFSGFGENIVEGLRSGLANTAMLAWQLTLMTGIVIAAGNAMASAGYTAGSQLMSGLMSGIQSQAGAIFSYLNTLADAVNNVMRSAFRIHSPSEMFAEIGGQLIAGLAQGLEKITPVQAALGSLTSTIPAMMPSGVMGAPMTQNQITIEVSVPISAETMRQNPIAQQYGETLGDAIAAKLRQKGAGIVLG